MNSHDDQKKAVRGCLAGGVAVAAGWLILGGILWAMWLAADAIRTGLDTLLAG